MNERLPKRYGYVRISDQSQKIHRQIDFMEKLGILEDCIYIDRQSGKDFERPAYKKLVKQLKAGDSLYIKELDRLGRNKEEIKEELKKLQDRHVRVRIMNIPTTMHDFGEDEWIIDMVNNIVIEVLAAVAEQERITNRKRQAEGIEAARARGVHLGRPALELPHNFSYYYNGWREKKMSLLEITQQLKISKSRFYSYARSYKNHIEKR